LTKPQVDATTLDLKQRPVLSVLSIHGQINTLLVNKDFRERLAYIVLYGRKNICPLVKWSKLEVSGASAYTIIARADL